MLFAGFASRLFVARERTRNAHTTAISNTIATPPTAPPAALAIKGERSGTPVVAGNTGAVVDSDPRESLTILAVGASEPTNVALALTINVEPSHSGAIVRCVQELHNGGRLGQSEKQLLESALQ
jgi:hypothetical protein